MDKLARFNKLSWEILEHKFRYYEGEKYKLKPIPDSEYDKLEQEYEELADELRKPASATQMIGFDYSRPACQVVFQNLTKGRENVGT